MSMARQVSRSATQTKKIARQLGQRLRCGDVVTLSGDLGAGKTTFAKGLAKALGVRSEREVSSPTFVLIHEYAGRLPVYHLDWYRLETVTGSDRRMAEECFDGEGVTIVEWPERGKALLPAERIEVRLRHTGPASRVVEIRARGKQHAETLKKK